MIKETITEWKGWNDSEAMTVFLELFQFASIMRAEPMSGEQCRKYKGNKGLFWQVSLTVSDDMKPILNSFSP